MYPSSKWRSINLFKAKTTPFIMSECPCSFLYCLLLSIAVCFTFLASEQPHEWTIPKHICYNVYRGSHSEKRSVSVYMFPNMPLKKIRHCNTEYQLPEDLQISSRKVQDSWKNGKANESCDVIYQMKKGTQMGHEETPGGCGLGIVVMDLQEGDMTPHSSVFILSHFSRALGSQAGPTRVLWSLKIGSQVFREPQNREVEPQRK